MSSKESKDLYSVLGVARGASASEIKKAYKRLARKFHPDLNPGNKGAEAKFKELSHAADILSDSEKRKLYDRYGEAAFSAGFDPHRAERATRPGRGGFPPGGSGPAGGIPFDFDLFSQTGGVDDIFEAFSRGGGRQAVRPAPGEPVEVGFTLSFADAVNGTSVTVPVQTRRHCTECGGSGHRDKSVCGGCHGAGERIETERVKVKIPEGVNEGSRVRVAGKGNPSLTGGPPGDLFVLIHVEPHPFFQRKGDEIFTEVPVTVREAYSGAEIEIPTIHGPVRAKIPPGTTGGQKFRLRGRGCRNLQTRVTGDHVYRVNIVIPAVQTDAGRQAADQLETLYGGPVRSHLPKSLE